MNQKKNYLTYLYILAIVNCIVLTILYGHQFNYDTESYLTAWSSFSTFKIDMWRTPVYPMFLGLLNFIVGTEHYLLIGTIIQHILFLISIKYFHALSKLIINNEIIILCITAFYALYPCIATWNCYIITEPFAIYGCIFLMYCAVTAYKKNSIVHIIWFSFWTFFLVFLRPAQMYILPVFLIAWTMHYIKDRKVAKLTVFGILGVCLSIGSLLFYSYEYKTQYGLFTPSGIGIINRYYIARMDGKIRPEHTHNISFQKFILESTINHGVKYSNGSDLNLYDESEEAIEKFGLKTVSDLLSTSDKMISISYIRSFIQRIHRAANDKLFSTQIHFWKNVTDIIGIKLNFIYFLLTVYSIALFLWIKNRKSFPWVSLVTYMLGVSHLFVIIFACQNVWERLILPAIPLYLIMIAQLCNMFIINDNPNKKFE